MKTSLVSATSLVALLAACAGSADAAVLGREPGPVSIHDLVHDEDALAGDGAAIRRERAAAAALALKLTSEGWQSAGFTGKLDRPAAMGDAYPAIPLGAAPGTKPIEDFASPVTGNGQWDAAQKARATGLAMIAPLIGKVGDNASANRKSGGTVFVAAGGQVGFIDGGRPAQGGFGGPASSTRTATITIPTTSRPGTAIVPYVATLPVPEKAPRDDARPVPGSGGRNAGTAVPPAAEVRPNYVTAAFSDAVTANGAGASDPPRPRTPAEIAAEADPRLIALARRVPGLETGIRSDGTRVLLSASVAADPPTDAIRYFQRLVRAAPTSPVIQSVESFQIGPTPGSGSRAAAGTTVADPLHDKIVTEGGALNNSLALP